jgi:hypothetical protein
LSDLESVFLVEETNGYFEAAEEREMLLKLLLEHLEDWSTL